jgi:glyoxylase-like metal-dependent hydrolase (beta-lactamase superfamily II)
MTQEITPIALPLPLGFGQVNCYLLRTEGGCILIDAGGHNGRTRLEQELERAACRPGELRLVILTHGDFDHTGNAAYLRDRYGAQIAMHAGDAGMIAHGDMFYERGSPGALVRWASKLLFRFDAADRFEPDIAVDDGYDLSPFGVDAQVLSIPGHSKGSIGVLTAGLDLFCGDLFVNRREPVLNDLIDDLVTARTSAERLQGLDVETVYPGHGAPFAMAQLKLDR